MVVAGAETGLLASLAIMRQRRRAENPEIPNYMYITW